MQRGTRVGLFVALGVIATGLELAHAGDGARPRTPVRWPDDRPCGWVIDTRETSSVRLAYEVPREDTHRTSDEVPGGRRHQFFALCRDIRVDAVSRLPRWITWDDVEAAVAAGVTAPGTVDASDVFEASEDWDDCWLRINADDARRPITFEAAAEGVEWPLSDVREGVYVLAGYTWDPPPSIWSRRSGFVRVTSDPNDPERHPAAAISTEATSTHAATPVQILGCVDAPVGSTLTGWWSRASRDEGWQKFAETRSVSADTFTLTFAPPPELEGDAAFIRVDVIDPRGRSWSAHLGHTLFVFDDEPQGASTSSGWGTTHGDSTRWDESSTTGSDDRGSSGASTSDPAMPSEQARDGCRCDSSSDPASPVGLYVLVLVAIRRRTASQPKTPPNA